MRIGVPKESKDKENRVAMTPEGVVRLLTLGHQVVVETGAGNGSGFSDRQYLQAGAEIAARCDAWAVDLVVKVKEPLESEYRFLDKQMIFTFFHLAGVTETLTEELLKKNVTAIAYETLEDNRGTLPLLAPMSAVAGNMSTLMGSYYLASFNQGRGVQLASVLGKSSGKVVVIGDGIVGQHAAKVATAMGAEVFIAGLNEEKFKILKTDVSFKNIRFFHSNADNISKEVVDADLVIGAVLCRGARAPKVLTKEMVKAMLSGSVVVDVSIDQGGCFETSRPTTHSNPVYIKYGVLHYCVTNMPGAFPRTATIALANATIGYIEMIAEKGVEAFFKDFWLAKAINTYQGNITYKKVALDLGMIDKYQNIMEIA